jgi:hypothetical protein
MRGGRRARIDLQAAGSRGGLFFERIERLRRGVVRVSRRQHQQPPLHRLIQIRIASATGFWDCLPATRHRSAVPMGDRSVVSMADRSVVSARDVLDSSWCKPLVWSSVAAGPPESAITTGSVTGDPTACPPRRCTFDAADAAYCGERRRGRLFSAAAERVLYTAGCGRGLAVAVGY